MQVVLVRKDPWLLGIKLFSKALCLKLFMEIPSMDAFVGDRVGDLRHSRRKGDPLFDSGHSVADILHGNGIPL